MYKKIATAISLLIISICIFFLNYQYPDIYLEKSFYTIVVLLCLYLVFKIFFEELAVKGIKDTKTKYSFKKTISVIFIAAFLIAIISIWVERPEALFVAFGLIGAGIAIALQDVFRNFAGGVTIFVNDLFRVGDRIELESKVGDVIDIGILYTTILEMKEWISAEQPTGRLTIIPNGTVLGGVIHNYTKDHNFVWDEIILPVTFDSDWKYAHKTFMDIAKKETEKTIAIAEQDISKLEQKYYLTRRVTEPTVYLKITDNWIEFYIRYVSEARQRRGLKDQISRKVLEAVENSENKIKLASATFEIVGFPEIKVKRSEKS